MSQHPIQIRINSNLYGNNNNDFAIKKQNIPFSLHYFNLANSSLIDRYTILMDSGSIIQSQLYKINLSSLLDNQDQFNKLLYKHNRAVDDERVENILSTFLNKKEVSEEINFLNGQIVIGFVKCDDPKILDGQHRLKVAMSVEKCDSYLNFVSFDNENDRFDYYIKINQNTPLPDFYQSCEHQKKYVINEVCQKIYNLYPQYFSQ